MCLILKKMLFKYKLYILINAKMFFLNLKLTLINLKLSLINLKLSLINLKLSLINLKLTLINLKLTLINLRLSLINLKLTLINLKLTLINLNVTLINLNLSLINLRVKRCRALNRGGLSIPGDSACQWTIFCYIIFNFIKDHVCRVSLIDIFQKIPDFYMFNIEKHHSHILSNILISKYCLTCCPKYS